MSFEIFEIPRVLVPTCLACDVEKPESRTMIPSGPLPVFVPSPWLCDDCRLVIKKAKYTYGILSTKEN